MAFNLFKKKEFADVLFKNGTIYTMDPETPIVESLACKDGLILALGDESATATLENEDTKIIDLMGSTMLPGFIDEHGTPVTDAFKGSYVELLETMDQSDIVSAIRAYVKMNPEEDYYLAYGYNEKEISENNLLEFRKALNDICDTKPVVLIAADGLHMALNTFAADTVLARAEELDVNPITPPFVTDALLSADYVRLIKNIMEGAFQKAQCGYTTVFNKATLSYFDNVYRDILVDAFQDDLLKQRYYGSYLLNRPFAERVISYNMAQKHTACAELDQKINFETLYIVCAGNEENPCFMTEDYLAHVCDMTADKGYGIRIAAADKASALSALNVLGNLRESYKKLYLSVEHKEEFSEEELSHIFGGILPEYSSDNIFRATNPEEAIYERTVLAAERMGLAFLCGSIEKGKWADFAIFSDNPFQAASMTEFSNCKARMTVLAGNIVYDSSLDSAEKWIKTMTEQLNCMESDLSL